MCRPTCQECGTKMDQSKRREARFCSTACRKSFNNRRAVRGAQLYDAFMAMRYDRKTAEALGIDWKLVCRMGEMFNAEDKEAGRAKSWRKPTEFVDEHGAMINARHGRL